jgi:hypothetical protein
MLRNPEQASDLLNALLNGERVRMRYYMYPSYEQRDIELRVPTLAYGYGKGVEQCGWEDLGAPKELPKAEAEVLSEGDPNSENAGFALVQINGNDALTLRKQFDKFGGGCSFQVNSSSLFGMNRGTWTAEHYGKTISIYSGDGQKLFEAEGPGFEEKDEAWPAAAEAAEAAWKADPRGRMVVSSEYIGDDSTSLYGFRALWEWGMDRCGFPPIGND